MIKISCHKLLPSTLFSLGCSDDDTLSAGGRVDIGEHQYSTQTQCGPGGGEPEEVHR